MLIQQKEWFPGGEWGFHAQIQLPSITSPPTAPPSDGVPSILQTAHDQRGELQQAAVIQHIQYWDHTSPGQHFEHHKYEVGWKTGFQDALIFFQGCAGDLQPGSRIGCREMWVLKRVRESGYRGRYVWEFEQGVRKGVEDFERVVCG